MNPVATDYRFCLLYIINIFSTICYADQDDEGCAWVQNNRNTNGEQNIGVVSSRDECIHLVMTQCPTATLANTQYEFESTTSCWCQYGTDMNEDSSGWSACMISTLSDQYISDLYTTYGGGQFYRIY